MNTYKVKQEDLIGQLEGFPIEVVQAMIDEQVRQGNKADVSIFQICVDSYTAKYGFDWCNSKEGEVFWEEVIMAHDFNTFFEKYPKQQSESKYCNLYHNNATMKFKTGEHTYSDSDTAYENRKEDVVDGYRYFTTIECSIKE